MMPSCWPEKMVMQPYFWAMFRCCTHLCASKLILSVVFIVYCVAMDDKKKYFDWHLFEEKHLLGISSNFFCTWWKKEMQFNAIKKIIELAIYWKRKKERKRVQKEDVRLCCLFQSWKTRARKRKNKSVAFLSSPEKQAGIPTREIKFPLQPVSAKLCQKWHASPASMSCHACDVMGEWRQFLQRVVGGHY